ncbi:MAG TPA: aminotransferase class I/II-fold pyridoxal phosphate-dependent enzyme [Usitatibacter sp.]|jgi:glutamate/tyrosine decarboxylase-like PLP-dependent enzyme|nr:aminotransferase class I/II-fold pyridoxal phosphate-dependent enzyme [Usitatibacter sp.]
MTYALERHSLDALRDALDVLERGFAPLPAASTAALGVDGERVLLEVAQRLHDNYPYFHPLYAGQMLKPPHPVARAAAALAGWVNPNNHALDGGRASSRMEKEAVAQLAAMAGWDAHLGHLTSGGTMANLEALWIAGKTAPGRAVAASRQAHYTHERISAVLGLDFVAIDVDRRGRMSMPALEEQLRAGRIGTVVATLGTTATGSVDPLPEILELRSRYGFRLHVDAAYGGYFTLVENLAADTRAAFDRAAGADSLVIDPHKHGLQPYGCGCVLFRDPSVGRFYQHDSPYTYFSSSELHLGEISLECSRPGASAVALWATQRLLPLAQGGEFARLLGRSRAAALALHARLASNPRFVTPFAPELDIVVWAPRSADAAQASARSRAIFEACARRGLHLAVAQLPAAFFDHDEARAGAGAATITCLRSVLMKPEHLEWVDRMASILDDATDEVLAAPVATAS